MFDAIQGPNQGFVRVAKGAVATETAPASIVMLRKTHDKVRERVHY